MFLLSRQFFLREREVRRALSDLAAQGLKPRHILDAGTGYGQYALALRRFFPTASILSVDLNPACVERLDLLVREGGLKGVAARQADLLDFQVDPPVDLVLNVDVVEHIQDDQRVFNGFARALNPGGLLLLHTPAMEDALSEEEVLRRTPAVGEHAREGYTRGMMRQRLRDAGLEEISLRSTYGRAGGLAWRLGVRAPLRMLSWGLWSLPLVLLWLVLVLLPVRLLNALDVAAGRGASPRPAGGCMLVLARRPVARRPLAGAL